MIREDYKWLTDTYVAHRGLFDNVTIPENSIPAFEKAHELGFAIETDVQMTKDGVLVVMHDATVKRMTGKEGLLSDYTLQELRQFRLLDTDCQIPTFQEYLEAASGSTLLVEIKTHNHIGEVEAKVYDALQNYQGHYSIESFNPFVLRWFKKHHPEVVCGQLSCSFADTPFSRLKKHLLSQLRFCKWNGSRFIAFDSTDIATNKAVKKFSKTIPILCWTIQSQQQFDSLKDHFDNIIFDSFLPERQDKVEFH